MTEEPEMHGTRLVYGGGIYEAVAARHSSGVA